MDLHKLIGRLPRPEKGWVLPNHKYTGPYNPLDQQLGQQDVPLPGQEPFNAIDAVSMRHDICYRDRAREKGGKHKCDDLMLQELNQLEPKDLRERVDKRIVKTLIGTKRRLGLGLPLHIGSAVEWSNPLTDELHRPARRNYPKRQVFVRRADDIWAADLVDMQKRSRSNAGFKHILMIIDVFSKYGWAIPLKNKTAVEMVRAFTELFDSGQKPPKHLWTDKGGEFTSKLFRAFLKERHVHLYWTENLEKSCIVERWNRTIKSQMWKYFTANRTGVYIYILPDLIKKYNNTYHRSIHTTPSEARKPSNQQHVFDALYRQPIKTLKKGKKKPKFHLGESVRISKIKGLFEKGYEPNWSEELYSIAEVNPTIPWTYKIKDTRGEVIQGTFYEPELQHAAEQRTYRIERVIRRRTNRDGVKQAYVKWSGYDNSFNQWIPQSDIEE